VTQTILVIEDESSIADTITYALQTDGFEPVWCATGAEGRQRLSENNIALIILDIGLPDVSGIELCKEIRQTSEIPIIFLTARSDEIDRVVGLEIGGDDYMVKPFSPRELTARVKAVLRRFSSTVSTVQPPNDTSYLPEQCTPFSVDTVRMSISYHGSFLDLTKCEFKLLEALIQHPGRVFSREQLKEIAWDEPEYSLDRTVDTHVKTLRNKLRKIKPDVDPIETRRGFGYALREL